MELPGTEKWKFTDIQFLPIVREFAKQINLVETINTMVDSKMRLTPGDVVLAMVIDTVTGRKPLYRFEESLHALDTELILGKPIDPAEFNDTNLGRAMDKLYETGTHRIFPRYPKMPLTASSWTRSIIILTSHLSPCLGTPFTLRIQLLSRLEIWQRLSRATSVF